MKKLLLPILFGTALLSVALISSTRAGGQGQGLGPLPREPVDTPVKRGPIDAPPKGTPVRRGPVSPQ